MVPKLFSSGKSFAKLGAYLLHDAGKAKSSERVKWTHTLNLAHDEPACAIDEMLWTYRAAEDLKRQTGGRTGGRPLKNPVRHFSLNWHPSEQPTPEHMVRTVQDFLRHMGWHEHQALIVRHDDKHPHVHVMVNAIHPETGRALDAGFERRRAQKWAERYEREHGVFCEQRLKPVEEREASPTRESWERMKQDRAAFDEIQRSFDYFKRQEPQGQRDDEWLVLKGHQRDEREEFWKTGKAQFREARDEAFREVKAEFRHEWKGYFEARKAGADTKKLVALKADILARQNKALDERRTEAHAKILGLRKETYRELLDGQQRMRDQLKEEQKAGHRSYGLLDAAHPRPLAERHPELTREPPSPERKAVIDKQRAAFRDAANETVKPATARSRAKLPRARGSDARPAPMKTRDRGAGRALGGPSGIGVGALGAIATIGERLFDGFFGGESPTPEPPKQKPRELERDDETLHAANEQRQRETAASEEAALLAYWHERRQRRRERD